MARILIVDDDDISRMLLGETLRGANYTVVEAAGVDAALEVCRSTVVDLVIADILMPGKTGLELVLDLQRTNPELKIILLSSGVKKDASPSTSLDQALGVYATLGKPFEVDELLTQVRGALRETQPH